MKSIAGNLTKMTKSQLPEFWIKVSNLDSIM